MPETVTAHTAQTQGPLRLLVVDITGNTNGFEHRTSRSMTQKIQSIGIHVTPNSPVLVAHEEHLYESLTKGDQEFNTLLLVAHGGPDPDNGKVSKVAGPEGKTHWYALVELIGASLQDKFVMLCVCYGDCEDARSAFVSLNSICMSILAPGGPLSVDEATAFFPEFLRQLHPLSLFVVDPNNIASVLNSTNSLSGGKMRLTSEGLSAPGE